MAGPAQPTTVRAEDASAGRSGRSTGGPRRVLVTVASRHGATREIAQALGARLDSGGAGRSAGLMAVVLPVEQRPDPAPYDAVVLGSAAYAGRWLEPARDYASIHAADGLWVR
jgi:menaquinone-dependent protoporphyrinogen oxidase